MARTSGVPIPDSYWLLEGRLLAGEYPGAKPGADAKPKLERFLDTEVVSFIDLTEEHELEPYDSLLRELAHARGMVCRYQRLKIRDVSIPTQTRMAEILSLIRSEMAAGRIVYFHCWGGVGRTGTVAGCWLVERGLSGDEALARIQDLRATTPKAWRISPETIEQEEFVRSWERRRRRE